MGHKEDILAVRRKRENLALVLQEYSGIRKIVEDLYPDSAHFIYELLQNAEDTGATETFFTLMQDNLRFTHNGRPFNQNDVEAITNIGQGTKIDSDDKIGRFGIGFKAVFAYSETPRIFSSSLSFEISELVLPSPLDSRGDLGNKTVFEFPFNNPKKDTKVAYAEIKKAFDDLAEITILFLPNIESISWKIEGSTSGELLRVHHSDAHCEILKQINGRTTTSAHFLKFDTPVEGLEKQKVAIAFELDFLAEGQGYKKSVSLTDQLKIVPAKPGRVAVFFPAEKETSNLRFHLHAPFVPELSRASIKETPANTPLFEQITRLTTSALHKIKDMGLLTGEFLAVLPNSHDDIPERYSGIHSAVIEAFNTEALTPTYRKSYAAAHNLLQGKAVLKELLSEDDLEFLIEYEEIPPQWSISATQRNSNVDRFLNDLEIEEWDVDEFASLLKENLEKSPWKKPDESFQQWLAKKSAEWHQQMYALFSREMETSYSSSINTLSKASIILLDNGSHGIGCESFFVENALTQDKTLQWVNPETYASGKNKQQQENAKKFLQKMGVREAGEAEQVEIILKQRYTQEAEIPDTKTYLEDLKRFISLTDKEAKHAMLFKDYFIFFSKEETWHVPSDIFLDSPFQNTGLNDYYDLSDEEETSCHALNEAYQDYGIPVEKIAKFAELTGAKKTLEIKKVPIWENPRRSQLLSAGGLRTTSPINRDYIIENIQNVLENPSLSISRLVWETMRIAPQSLYENCYQEDVLRAVYRNTEKHGAEFADSQLVCALKEAKWIPQKKEGAEDIEFVKPADAIKGLIPEGFSFDAGWPWIKALKFGLNAQHSALFEITENQKKQAAAKTLGFEDVAAVERAQKFSSLPKDEQERILSAHVPSKPSFPERSTSNPERRKERVADRYNESEDVTYAKKSRNVRISSSVTDKKEWLKDLYTNDYGQMICQMCEEEMPFKLRETNEYYFEAIQIADETFKHEDHTVCLALCPLCAAKYQQLLKKDDGAQEQFLDSIASAESTENAIPLNLGDTENGSIKFVETHLCDLQAILEQHQSENDDYSLSEHQGR